MLANNLTPNVQISKAMLESVKASNQCNKNKLQERRDAQNEDITSRNKKAVIAANNKIAKKKSLLLTSSEKDIKRSHE